MGIPNICFSLIDKDDKREERFSKQRIERGFDDSETWCLASAIAKFIVPRIERFREIECGVPSATDGSEDWKVVLEKIQTAFELVLKNDASWIWTNEEKEQFREGMYLFRDYYLDLWW